MQYCKFPNADFEIELIQGNDVVIPFVYKDATGTPVNISSSGFVLEASLKKNEDDAAFAVGKAQVTMRKVNSNGLTGDFEMVLADEVTAPLLGDYWFDILLTDPTGAKQTLVRGKLIFLRRITV